MGVNAEVADIHMWSGLHARVYGRSPGGYGSRELILWQETDTTFRGRCMLPTDEGGMMLNAHPDTRPMPGQGPLEPPVPRSALSPGGAIADAKRVIIGHVEHMQANLGRAPTRLDILRYGDIAVDVGHGCRYVPFWSSWPLGCCL